MDEMILLYIHGRCSASVNLLSNLDSATGGPTGRKCVERLLSLGRTVRAVVRSPEKYSNTWQNTAKLNVVRGDVTNLQSLEEVLHGARGVIFAASTSAYFDASVVDTEGVRNTAQVAQKTGAHVVLISSALVSPRNRYRPLRILLNKIRWNLMDAKFAGETALRESGAMYTIVRPAHLSDEEPGKSKMLITQRDTTYSGKVPRADVAAVCVAALDNSAARSITFELATDPARAAKPEGLDNIFEGLLPGVF